MRPTMLSFLALAVLAVPAAAAPSHHARAHHKTPKHHSRAVAMTWDAQMADFLPKCQAGVSADQVARVMNRSSEMLAQRGIRESPLSVLAHVNASVTNGIKVNPADICAVYVTLREDG